MFKSKLQNITLRIMKMIKNLTYFSCEQSEMESAESFIKGLILLLLDDKQ